MHRRENFIPFFLVFFVISVVIIIVGKTGLFNSVTSILNKGAAPAKSAVLGVFSFGSGKDKAVKELVEENEKLRKQVQDNKNLMMDNKALRDQFASSGSSTQDQLPARVVGYPGFIPGVTYPEHLIIDKGSGDGIRKGDAVVSGTYLVGQVSEVTTDFSKVELVINKSSSFTAKIALNDGKDISGIIKGKGNEEMIFENVLLTDRLRINDIITTKGDQNEKGEGYPPDLQVGKITSIEKKSSDLFQKAAVKSEVDFNSLNTVFVLK
jgi:rod shape-determining protein MreC